MNHETRLAWAYLSRVAEPPCEPLADLVAEEGPVAAAERIRRGAVNASLGKAVGARREIDCAAEDLEVLDRRGGRLIVAGDDEWPEWPFLGFDGPREGRRRLEDHPPLVLWVVGPENLADVSHRAVSVVGTRACTRYGEQMTADLVAGLAERDVTVVSGGAFGIDGAAHRTSLACDGVTVAVLPGGVDVYYPAGHSALLHRVSTSGLLISEYPPGVRPARYRFLTRNRLVAVLSGATVVVEAGLRSGAANTAGWARNFGRAVCAVPGPVTSGASAGCHEMLRRGEATLVTRAEEIVEEIGRVGELADEIPHPTTALDGLTVLQRRVYESVPGRGTRSVNEIAVASGVPVAQVVGQLAMLEIEGLLQRDEGRWRLAKRAS